MKDNNNFRYLLQTTIDLYAKKRRQQFSDVLAEMNDQLGYGRNSMTIQKWLVENIVPNSAEVEYFAKKLSSELKLDSKWIEHFFDVAGYETPEYLFSAVVKPTQEIFISYTKADMETVQCIYDALQKNNLSPWMDIYSLKGGENWIRTIYKAIDDCEIFLAILSTNSVSRRGVVQKELKKALDKWNGMLPDDIYIIPVRIDDCPIPELLKHIHVLNWDGGKGAKKLIEAIEIARKKRNGAQV